MRMGRVRTAARLRRAMALVGVAALLLTACGGEADDSAAADGDTDDGVEETDEDDGDAEDVDEGEPQAGGTFTFAAFAEIDGLDPVSLRGYASNGGIPGEALYDTLLKIDAESGEPVPHMASLEPLDEGVGQQWEMVLEDGIEFHDGTALDAEAVAFNIRRHQDPEAGSQFITQVGSIADIEVVDDLTLHFELAHPWAAFPSVFTHVVGMIASPTAVEEHGEDYNQNPVGAGPFEFVSWTPDDELVLERNDDYWRDGLPYLDRWVQRPMTDEQARLAAAESGEVDVAFQSFLTSALISTAENDHLELIELYGDMGGGMMLNTQSEHLEDVRVRQAIAHLLDYEAIGQVTNDGQIPEDVRGVFRSDSPWYSGVEWPETDPEEAERLLTEYREDTGVEEIAFSIQTLPERRGFAELMQQMLRGGGLEVEVDILDVSELIPAVFGGTYEATIWSLPHPMDPDLQLFQNFHSSSPQNSPQLENDELDEALMRGRTTLDEDERRDAYAEAERILAEEQPYIMNSPSIHLLLVTDHVRGIEYRQDGQFDSALVWLDE